MIPDDTLKLTRSAALDVSGATVFATSADWIDLNNNNSFFGGGRPLRMLIHVLGDFEIATLAPEFIVTLVAANSADLLTAPIWLTCWGIWGNTLNNGAGLPRKNEMYEVIVPSIIASSAVPTTIDPNAPTRTFGSGVWGRRYLRALYLNTVGAGTFTATPAAGGNGAQMDIYLTHDVPTSSHMPVAALNNAT